MRTFTTQINRGGHILFHTCHHDAMAFFYGIKSAETNQGTVVLIEAKTFDFKGDWHTVGSIELDWTGSDFVANIEALENLLEVKGAVRFEATLFLGTPSH